MDKVLRTSSMFHDKSLIYSLVIKGIKPLSLNQMYTSSRSGHRFLSKEWGEYEQRIKELLAFDVAEKKLEHLFKIDHHLAFYLDIGIPDIYYKNGNIKRLDTSNYFKPVEDAVSTFFGYDDTLHFEVNGRKFYSPEYIIQILIYKFL